MRKFILQVSIVLAIILNTISCSSQSKECKICGNWRWEKNDERHDFSVNISIRNDSIVGTHCYILNSGDKMDCSAESGDLSFRNKNNGVDSITFSIRSYYSGKLGIAKLKLKNRKLYWSLIEAPKGEYYLPREAALIVDKKN